MKRITIYPLIWLLLIGFTTAVSAQESTYKKKPGYWTLGLNGGFAYQQSDVRTRFDGFGLGLTLGKNLYYAPNAPFSFSARGRLLYSRTYGLDDDQSFGLQFNDALNGNNGPDYTQAGGGPGFVYQNHKTDLGELGLEGVLTFNQLRERTGVILSLYGGVGLDLYQTKLDQLDGVLPYNDGYTSLNPQGSRSSIRNQLKENILDGVYETNAHSFEDGARLTVMPSLGFELGYQLGPSFSMGVGHRVTWARNDLLDGQQWNDNNSLTGNNDIHHYTSLHMRWDINKKEKELELPQITIIDPNYNPYKAANPNAAVKARIRNVSSAMDITATLNGYSLPFDFNRDIFTANCLLETGTNEVVITATNAAGSVSEKVIFTLKDLFEETPKEYLPQVRFTNPPNDEYRVSNDRFNLRAQVQHIKNRNGLELTVNGRNVTNFNFSSSRNELEADIRLEEGRNSIRLTASNSAGTDQDNTSIIYDAPVQVEAPRVNITRPSSDPFRTDIQRATVEADIDHIDSRRQIRLEINGRASDRFDYRNGFLRAEINLREGRNIISIYASNESGNDQDETSIYYETPYEPPVTRAPVVDITDPGAYEVTVSTPSKNIRATIRNVDRRSDIRFLVNGRSSSRFDFDSRRELFTANITLREGSNDIRIEARNEGGRDEASARIIYKKEIVIQPKRLPTVRITRPSDGSRTDVAEVQLEADVRFVNRKSDIEIQLNGRRWTNFDYDQRRQEISAKLRLENGRNRIMVIATNRDGRDQDEVEVTYERQKQLPTVIIKNPANGSTTASSKSRLEAEIQNVSNRSDITVELNGRRINSFSYDSRRGTLRADLTLQEGNNNIRVSARNQDGSDQDEANVDYRRNRKPPTVSISKPADRSTVSEPKVSVTASIQNVSSKSDIQFELNGRRINSFSFDSRRGTFSASLTLEEGNNNIRIKASNNDGSDQDEVRVTYRRTRKPPTVSISKPSNRAVVSNPKVSVTASIQNVSSKSDIQFELNGRRINSFSFDSRRGAFSASLSLEEGNNNIRIKASNNDGSDQDEVDVTYRRTRKPPTVSISKPSDRAVLSTPQASVTASIQNVSNKSDIQFDLNGRRTSSFSFDSRQGRLSAKVSLKEGNNTIRIKVSNEDGSDQDEVRVSYNARKRPPVVSITKPTRDGQGTMLSSSRLEAKVENVDRKEDISLAVNGKKQSNFTYDSKTKLLKATIKLAEGNNRVVIEATNKDGRDQASINIVRKVRLLAPIVDISTPKNNSKVSKKRIEVKASIRRVENKNEVTFKLNGKTINNFELNGSNFRASIDLKEGDNKIELSAKTKGGSDKDDVKVTYTKPIAKPKVTFVKPAKAGSRTRNMEYSLVAKVENVSDKKNISLYINGKKTDKFQFNTKDGEVATLAVLKSGKNTFKITASNKAGKAEAETFIQTIGRVSVPGRVKKPVITDLNNTVPVVNPLSPNTSRVRITATIKNILNKSQITFKLNGKGITDFTFDTKSGKFTALVELSKGKTEVSLEAKNSAGSTKKEKTIEF